jgi:hypothetical protein
VVPAIRGVPAALDLGFGYGQPCSLPDVPGLPLAANHAGLGRGAILLVAARNAGLVWPFPRGIEFIVNFRVFGRVVMLLGHGWERQA